MGDGANLTGVEALGGVETLKNKQWYQCRNGLNWHYTMIER